jgi:DNA-binding ferritin-like protein
MDSEALEGLYTAADRLAERASSLKVAAATATCREILELTGVATHLRFFRDVQDAVRSFL